MRALKRAFPSFLCLLQAPCGWAADWHVTKYYLMVYQTSTFTYSEIDRTSTFIDTTKMTVKPGITPTATPTSTALFTQTYTIVGEVEYEDRYLPVDAVGAVDLYDVNSMLGKIKTAASATGSSSTSSLFSVTTTDWYSPVVYTAPASCPTPHTLSTSTMVYIPEDVASQLRPTSVTTSEDKGVVRTKAYLTTSALPSTVDPMYDEYYRVYMARCSTLATDVNGGNGSGTNKTADDNGNGHNPENGGDDDDDDETRNSYCRPNAWCETWTNWIVIIISVFAGVFFLGFIESYLWFRRLMLGKSALRMGTICWILMSIWFVFFTRRQVGKSKEDQETLRRMWDATSTGLRIELWLKWGFRHTYPTELLGPAPGSNPPGTRPVTVAEWFAYRNPIPMDERAPHVEEPAPPYEPPPSPPPAAAATAAPASKADEAAAGSSEMRPERG